MQKPPTQRRRHGTRPYRKVPAALSRLRNIAAIRPEFANLEAAEVIAVKGANLAIEHVDAQSASVFVFDQVGRLARIALVGKDKAGRELDNDSLPPEFHQPGESFTGLAVVPHADSPFGEAQWSKNLSANKQVNAYIRQQYFDLLGEARSAVSIPLNGSHRTFGVLEVINKIHSAASSFDVEDVHWLSLIGHEIALSLSDRRRQRRLDIFHLLAEAAVSMFAAETEERELYRRVADALTSTALPYRVCIIRLRTAEGLSTVAAASSEVPLSGRDDSPVPSSHQLAGSVFQTGTPIYVLDIRDRDPATDGLRNWEWAIDNSLVTYACFPLRAEAQIVGTLSLYFGFRYSIDDDEKAFLGTLARSLAAFWNGRRLLQEFQEISREDALDAATAKYDSQLVPSRHDMLDFLRNLNIALANLEGKNLGTSSGEREYSELLDFVSDQAKKIREEFSVSRPEVVDLNDLIRAVIAQNRKIPRDTYIDFEVNLNRRLPPIKARTSALRYVIKDLLTNAAKSIQRKGEGYGVVKVSTDVAKEKHGMEWIQLIVEDSGEGIPREHWEAIFDAGYTSYEGGTGLGLHLARGILSSSYGGRIEIASSTVGEGSVFKVQIPMWNRA